ncbi:hypothetical protein [Sandaracinus amylolyticus]|uniref:hypothetical protein n=1 Tax=Sandaracinus amylolyticus TaxID=927083 RepID=UPI0012ED7CDF|nr:hypothetical protein [Sandaracinus amylolyticus]
MDEEPSRLHAVLEWLAEAGHMAIGAPPARAGGLLAVSSFDVIVLIVSDGAWARPLAHAAARCADAPRVCWLETRRLTSSNARLLSVVDELLGWPIVRVDLVAAIAAQVGSARRGVRRAPSTIEPDLLAPLDWALG